MSCQNSIYSFASFCCYCCNQHTCREHNWLAMAVCTKTLVVFSLVFLGTSFVRAERQSRVAKIIHSRGYLVKDHYLDVQNGEYTLHLVRATNPLINNGQAGLRDRNPILFIHGIVANANSFVFMSDGAAPKNYTAHDINSMSVDQLKELLKNDHGSKSLVFTALNFGYEVWLLNRRATFDSHKATIKRRIETGAEKAGIIGSLRLEGLIGSNSYFNFSFDDQAIHDIPETIDYILERTGKQKLIVVSYSAGVAVTLMALTDKPQLASKISKTVFWAPSMDFVFGYKQGFIDNMLINLLPITARMKGPILPQFANQMIHKYTSIVCGYKLLRPFYCDPIFSVLFGKGAHQLRSKYFNSQNYWLDSSSQFEFAQYVQSVKKGKMYHFDYEDKKKNLRAYGKPEPPVYSLERIKLDKMTFWVGNTDGGAKVINFKHMRERFTVPIEEHIVGGEGDLFQHYAFALHKNITQLLIIPSLRTIASQ